MSTGQFIVLTAAGAASAFAFRLWGFGGTIEGGGEAYNLARSLALHGTFADPFAGLGNTGPSAHMTPLFPLLLAAIMRISDATFASAVFVLALLTQGLTAAMLPLLSQHFFKSSRPGWIASSLVIGLPLYRLYPTWDAAYSGTLLMAGVLALIALFSRGRSGMPQAAAGGCMAAILFLFNPIGGLVLVVFLVGFVLFSPRFAPQRLFLLLIAAAVTVIGISPWIVRNYVVFGRLIPLRDDLGIALYSSNNGCAGATLEDNLLNGCHAQTHPIGSASENRLVAEMGEAEYNRDRLRLAMHWIAANKSRFAKLTLERVRYFWFPQRQPAVWAVTMCGLAGLILAIWREPRAGVVFLVALLAYSVLYYAVESQERYLYPAYWCVCLCAGYLLDFVSRRFTAPAEAKL